MTRRTRPLRAPPADDHAAAADSASSNESSSWTAARMSSTTVVRPRHGVSSWRIISSPVRATDGQCTRRRSSPCSYSTSAKKSPPVAPMRRGPVHLGERIGDADAVERRDGVDPRVDGQLAWPGTASVRRATNPKMSERSTMSGPRVKTPRRSVGSRNAASAPAPGVERRQREPGVTLAGGERRADRRAAGERRRAAVGGRGSRRATDCRRGRGWA